MPKLLPRYFAVCLVALLAGLGTGSSHAQAETDVSFTIVNTEWTPPPTTLPQEYVDAVKVLLGNGLSDPRGGEFRKAKVRCETASDLWSPEVKIGYGWVLPGAKEIVAVDGLIYEITEDFGATTLEDFIKHQENISFPTFTVEKETIAFPALLLVLGNASLAEECMKKWEGRTDQLYAHLIRRYQKEQSQALFNGADAKALQMAHLLASSCYLRLHSGLRYENLQAEARDDMEEANQILRDSERRSKQPNPPLDLDKYTTPVDRIGALMVALEDIRATRWSRPGDIYWSREEIVTAIVNEGEAAVPALINTIEHDDRLTRTIDLSTPVPVRIAAFETLKLIWPAASTVSANSPKEKSAALRKLWASTSNLSPGERWLEVLRDDMANGEAWLTAAKALTEQPWLGGQAKPQRSPGMFGEPLRAGHGEEINRLLAQRIQQTTTLEKPKDWDAFQKTQIPLKLACHFAKWDLPAALPSVKESYFHARQMTDQGGGSFSGHIYNISGQLLTSRIRAGDESAIPDFAALIERLKTAKEFSYDALRPLWRFPENARVQAIGATYFSHLVNQRDGEKMVGWSASHPLIKSSAYRDCFVVLLASEDPLGTARLAEKEGQHYVRVARYDGSSYSLTLEMDLTEVVQHEVVTTVGDKVAQALQSIKPAPRYVILWPAVKRAAARRELAQWLQQDTAYWTKLIEDDSFAHSEDRD